MGAHFCRIDGEGLRTQLMGDKETSDTDELLEFDPRSEFNFMKHSTRQFGTKGIWGISGTWTSHMMTWAPMAWYLTGGQG
jgi:hypothetical protein